MDIKADIIDYMGLISDGVLVLLSVISDGDYSEATLFYKSDDLLLTVDRKIEQNLGCAIEEWDGYRDLLESILAKLVPFEELKKRLGPVKFEEYLEIDSDIFLVDEVDGVVSMSGTYSNLV